MRCGTSSSTFTDCPTRYDPPSNVEKYAPRAATFWVTVRPNTDARAPFSLSTRIGYLSVSRGLVLCSDFFAIGSSQCLCAAQPRANSVTQRAYLSRAGRAARRARACGERAASARTPHVHPPRPARVERSSQIDTHRENGGASGAVMPRERQKLHRRGAEDPEEPQRKANPGG